MHSNKLISTVMLKDTSLVSTNLYATESIDISSSRIEFLSGTEYLVVPMVILLSKVVFPGNSTTGQFIPANVLEASVNLWDGTPVIVNHPAADNEDKLGNSITTVEELGLGTLSNTKFENDKLYSELWINKAVIATKTNNLVTSTYSDLCDNVKCEVSVGVQNSYKEETGVYLSSSFTRVWTSISPLHLAVLNGAVGACSNADGCGTIPTELEAQKIVEDKAKVELDVNSSDDCTCKKSVELSAFETEIALLFSSTMYSTDKEKIIYDALDSKFGYCYLYTYNDSTIVFEHWNDDTNNYSYYKCFYTYDAATTTLSLSDKILIRLTVNIVELFSKRKKELFNNLSTLSKKDALVPTTDNTQTKTKEETSLETTTENIDESEIDMKFDGMNTLQAIEEMKKNGYSELASLFQGAVQLETKVNTTVINALSSNPSCKFSVEQLNKMDFATLQSLHASLQAQTTAAPTQQQPTQNQLAKHTTPTNDYQLAGGANTQEQIQETNLAQVPVADYLPV